MSAHVFAKEMLQTGNAKLNKVLAELVTDKTLNTQVEDAFNKLEQHRAEVADKVLAKFDLSAEERQAILSKDFNQLVNLGANMNILKRAEWCTGD